MVRSVDVYSVCIQYTRVVTDLRSPFFARSGGRTGRPRGTPRRPPEARGLLLEDPGAYCYKKKKKKKKNYSYCYTIRLTLRPKELKTLSSVC
eukprot:2247711-Prymnesium_polylepis.1